VRLAFENEEYELVQQGNAMAKREEPLEVKGYL
jgi:hypothetical protein